MTGKTHRVGGMLCCLGGYSLLSSKGLLPSNMNPMLQLLVMYPFAIYGSTVSDLDHDWHSAPSRDIISFGINKALHLTTKVRSGMREDSPMYKALGLLDAKHRSWQTHSDLFLAVMLYLALWLVNTAKVGTVDQVFLRLISIGMILGVISHLILDMLTPEGVWSLILCVVRKVSGIWSIPRKIHFVPKSEFFKTGGTWETIIRWLLWLACFIMLGKILLDWSPISLSFIRG